MLYQELTRKYSAVGPGLVGRLSSVEVELVRDALRRQFQRDQWTAGDGALLLLGGALAMRENGARANWTTLMKWIDLQRQAAGAEDRARAAMAKGETLYGRPLLRRSDQHFLYIGTMFRDSGQLWRLLLSTLEGLGNRDGFWRAARAWTTDDWAELVKADEPEAGVALAERLAEVGEGRALLAELQLVRRQLDATCTAAEQAGLDLHQTFGVQSDEEARALLSRIFRFQTVRVGPSQLESASDTSQWGVARVADGSLKVVVRLAQHLPAADIASDLQQIRVSDPRRPREDDLGQRADIVAVYKLDGNEWALSQASEWVEVSVDGLRIVGRRNERPFPLPEFPQFGILARDEAEAKVLLARDEAEAKVLPVLAAPRHGECCVLITPPDTEVHGLPGTTEVLSSGWVARRFRADAATTYTVTAGGVSVSTACGAGPVGCPLRLDGRMAPQPGVRMTIGGRPVFLGMPRLSALSAATRRETPIVRHRRPGEERLVDARWQRGTLNICAAEDAEDGEWCVEAPGGRWRAQFHVLSAQELPSVAWTGAGVHLELPRAAGWACGVHQTRGTEFYPPLPEHDAGPTIVSAVITGEPEYRWVLRGRAAAVTLLDATGADRSGNAFARSEGIRGDFLRVRGPAGGRVEMRVRGEVVHERLLSSEGQMVESGRLLFRHLDSGTGDVDVTVSVVGTEVARTFTLFTDGADSGAVGTLTNLELTTDEGGRTRLRLDADVQLNDPRLGLVHLGAEVPSVGWEDMEWRNEYRSNPLALLAGPYAVVLRGDRRLPNGEVAPDSRTQSARLLVPGAARPSVGDRLAERLKAQANPNLDLAERRRLITEVRADLQQLADVYALLDGPERAVLVRDMASLPAAAPRLAWWVLRARARFAEDDAIDELTLGRLERLLIDVGWHPSWIRYPALVLLLPPWPNGGYPAWKVDAMEAANRIAAIHPHLAPALNGLLQQEVIVHLVRNGARWPAIAAEDKLEPPEMRAFSVALPAEWREWERQARGLLADLLLEPSPVFLRRRFRLMDTATAGADAVLARKVLLQAIFLRDTPDHPTREHLDRWAVLLHLANHIESEPALAERARAWERALLHRFPLTSFGS